MRSGAPRAAACRLRPTRRPIAVTPNVPTEMVAKDLGYALQQGGVANEHERDPRRDPRVSRSLISAMHARSAAPVHEGSWQLDIAARRAAHLLTIR